MAYTDHNKEFWSFFIQITCFCFSELRPFDAKARHISCYLNSSMSDILLLILIKIFLSWNHQWYGCLCVAILTSWLCNVVYSTEPLLRAFLYVCTTARVTNPEVLQKYNVESERRNVDSKISLVTQRILLYHQSTVQSQTS